MSQGDPKTIDEASASKESEKWQEATDKDYDSLINMKTWDLAELRKDCKPIGFQWVFKHKYTEDKSIERYKGRLVTNGCVQRYGVDYQDIFSPVVKFDTLPTRPWPCQM